MSSAAILQLALIVGAIALTMGPLGRYMAAVWFTVLFANLAEAMAKGRGKAQAASLRRTRQETIAHRRRSDGTIEPVPSTALAVGDECVVTAVRHPDRLVTREVVLRTVWGEGYEDESGYLRVHMASVRRKLEPDPAHPRHFLTEPRMGYRFVSET